MVPLPPIRFETLAVEPVTLDGVTFDSVLGLTLPTYEEKNRVIEELIRQERWLLEMPALVKRGRFESADVLRFLSPSFDLVRRKLAYEKAGPVSDIIAKELTAHAYDKVAVLIADKSLAYPLARSFRRHRAVCITSVGGRAERVRQARHFRDNPDARIAIATFDVLDCHISLTSAAEVVVLDAAWDPVETAQGVMRAHMNGQGRPVRVRFAVHGRSPDYFVQGAISKAVRRIMRIYPIASCAEGDASTT